MVLGYKKKLPNGKPTNFKEKILAGTKIHSIREDGKDLWCRNINGIQHAYNPYSKDIRDQFAVTPFYGFQRIIIKWEYFICGEEGKEHIQDAKQMVLVGGHFLDDDMITELALGDGFDSREEFFEWFCHDFSGKLIHWTDKQY